MAKKRSSTQVSTSRTDKHLQHARWVRRGSSCECGATLGAQASDFLEHLEKGGVAFIPKTRSNCRKIGKAHIGAQADNDGVAIFWKVVLAT